MADSPDDEVVQSDTNLTEREESTLPKWAQERMATLRSAADKATAQYRDQFDAQDETLVRYGDVYNNPRFLPDSDFDRIMFSLANEQERTAEDFDAVAEKWLQFTRKTSGWDKKPYIEVTGSDLVTITPQASNVVRIHLAQRTTD